MSLLYVFLTNILKTDYVTTFVIEFLEII